MFGISNLEFRIFYSYYLKLLTSTFNFELILVQLSMTKTIVISGGHHTSALVIAQHLQNQGHKIIWFGHKHSLTNDTAISAEYTEVTSSHIHFINLTAPKFFNINLFAYSLQLFQTLWRFWPIWRQFQPDVFLGFGGYLMVPCAVFASFTKTHFFIHEQTQIAGRANYYTAPLAKKIFVSWPVKYPYPQTKTIFTGLPLRQEFLNLLKKPSVYPPLIPNSLPTLFVTAGKQGSHFINQLIKPLIPKLLNSFNIIHQTGQSQTTKDYLYFKHLQTQLATDHQKGTYLTYSYLNPTQMMQAYNQATLIISRSGAHTTYELALLGKPSILIPAPFVPRNEQVKNARFLHHHGLATILPQAHANPKKLLIYIHQLTQSLTKPKPLKLPLNATQRIIHYLLPYL